MPPIKKPLLDEEENNTWIDWNDVGTNARIKNRDDVGFLDGVRKKFLAGSGQISSALGHFAGGLLEDAGYGFNSTTLKDIGHELQGRADLADIKADQLIREAGGQQTFVSGPDSLKEKYKAGELDLLDVGRAVTDLAALQAPQLVAGGAAMKAGSLALRPVVSALGATSKAAPFIGGALGQAGFMTAQETGSIFGEQAEDAKDFGKALAFGVPAGLLESLGMMYGMSKSGVSRFILQELSSSPVKKSAKQVALDILKTGLAEGGTEVSQTILEQIGAEKGWNIEETLKNLDWEDIAESGIAGFLMGSGMTSVGSPIEQYSIHLKEKREELREQAAQKLQGIALRQEEDSAMKEEQNALDIIRGAQPVSLTEAPTPEELQYQESLLETERIAEEEALDTLAYGQEVDDELTQEIYDVEDVVEETIEYHPVEQEISATTNTDIKEVRTFAQKAKETAKNFSEWSKQMIERFGNFTKSALQQLWNHLKTVGSYVKNIQPGLSTKEVKPQDLVKAYSQEKDLQKKEGIAAELNKLGMVQTKGGSWVPATSETAKRQGLTLPDTETPKTETPKKINIYSSEKNKFKRLSNFNTPPVTYNVLGTDYSFKTVEHLYQFMKAVFADDTQAANKIFKAETAKEAQRIGKREVLGLNQKAWDRIAKDKLEEAMRLAFEQNPEQARLLLETGDAELTHKAPNFSLGRWEKDFPEILTRIRSELRGETQGEQVETKKTKPVQAEKQETKQDKKPKQPTSKPKQKPFVSQALYNSALAELQSREPKEETLKSLREAYGKEGITDKEKDFVGRLGKIYRNALISSKQKKPEKIPWFSEADISSSRKSRGKDKVFSPQEEQELIDKMEIEALVDTISPKDIDEDQAAARREKRFEAQKRQDKGKESVYDKEEEPVPVGVYGDIAEEQTPYIAPRKRKEETTDRTTILKSEEREKYFGYNGLTPLSERTNEIPEEFREAVEKTIEERNPEKRLKEALTKGRKLDPALIDNIVSDILSLSEYYTLDSVLRFIRTQENIVAISQLTEYPDSLIDIYEKHNSGVLADILIGTEKRFDPETADDFSKELYREEIKKELDFLKGAFPDFVNYLGWLKKTLAGQGYSYKKLRQLMNMLLLNPSKLEFLPLKDVKLKAYLAAGYSKGVIPTTEELYNALGYELEGQSKESLEQINNWQRLGEDADTFDFIDNFFDTSAKNKKLVFEAIQKPTEKTLEEIVAIKTAQQEVQNYKAKNYSLWKENNWGRGIVFENLPAFYNAVFMQANDYITRQESGGKSYADPEQILRWMKEEATDKFNALSKDEQIKLIQYMLYRSDLTTTFNQKFYRDVYLGEKTNRVDSLIVSLAKGENKKPHELEKTLLDWYKAKSPNWTEFRKAFAKRFGEDTARLYASEVFDILSIKTFGGSLFTGVAENIETAEESMHTQEPYVADASKESRGSVRTIPLDGTKLENWEHESDIKEIIELAQNYEGLLDDLGQAYKQTGLEFLGTMRKLYRISKQKDKNGKPTKEAFSARDSLYRNLYRVKAAVMRKQYLLQDIESESFFDDLGERFNIQPEELYDVYFKSGLKKSRLINYIQEKYYKEKSDKIYQALVGKEKTFYEVERIVLESLSEEAQKAYKDYNDFNKRTKDSAVAKEVVFARGLIQQIAISKEETSIAEEKYTYEGEPNTSDMFVENIDNIGFAAELQEKGIKVGRMRNVIAQNFYRLVSKAFNADLVVVSDNNYKSRYIGKASDGRSKIIINLKDGVPVQKLYAHELMHHVVNRATPAERKLFYEKIKDVYGNERFESVVNKAWIQSNDLNFTFEDAREEAIAEIFSEMFDRKEFYVALSKIAIGKRLSSKLLLYLLRRFRSISDVFWKDNSRYNYEKSLFLDYDQFLNLTSLYADIFGDFDRARAAGYSKEKYFSQFSKEVQQEFNEYAAKVKPTVKGFWSFLFPTGAKTRKEWFEHYEQYFQKIPALLDKIKPSGMWAHWNKDRKVLTQYNKVVHGVTERRARARKRIVEKNKNLFRGMSERKKERLHDFFNRGFLRETIVEEGKIKTIEIKHPVKMFAQPRDKKFTQEFRDYAKEKGISDEILDMYESYKVVADQIYDEMVQFYPNLPYRENHFGQSIQWYGKGKTYNDSLDRVLQPEESDIAGTQQYLQDKSDLATEVIAENMNYRTIDPHELFLNYVNDTARVILIQKFIDEGVAIKASDGKNMVAIFADDSEAAKNKYKIVNDNIMSILSTKESGEETLGYEIYYEKYTGEKIKYEGTKVFKTKKRAMQELKKIREEAIKNGKLEEGDLFIGEVFAKAKPAEVGRAYFHPDAARLLNVAFSRSAIWESRTGRFLSKIKNSFTTFELSMSLFHGTTMINEVFATQASEKHLEGKLGDVYKNPLSFLKKSVQNYLDIADLLHYVDSNPQYAKHPAVIKKLEELTGEKDVDAIDLMTTFYHAGGIDGLDRNLRASAHYMGEIKYRKEDTIIQVNDDEVIIDRAPLSIKAFMESIRKAGEDFAKENPNHPVAKFLAQTKFTFIEGFSAWLMEYAIPKFKLAAWVIAYLKRIKREQEKIQAKLITKEQIAEDEYRNVEDKFGEVNWINQNHAANFKYSLMFAFRSFTWFTGYWGAGSKAAVDFAKKAWFTVKGEEYKLTNRGLWALHAVASHVMMSMFLSVLMSAWWAVSGEDEAETPEEVPYITRLLFPRVDALDPYKRVSIPSYVTELYKIGRHAGFIGNERELSKLISGRFNSMLGLSVDVMTNSDWRGVQVYNPHQNLAKNMVDIVSHMMPMPISLSTMRRNIIEKGFAPADLATGALGFVSAPAAAMRSDAANKAFEIRRKEYKGREVTLEEMENKNEVKRAVYAYSQGNKDKVYKLMKEGKLSKRQFENEISKIPFIRGKKNPLYLDPLARALKGLTIKGAIEVWDYMTEEEKNKNRAAIIKKYKNMAAKKDRPAQYKKDILNDLKEKDILR